MRHFIDKVCIISKTSSSDNLFSFTGTENVEPAPFQACWNLVAASRRERKQKEDEKRKEEAERKWEEEKLWQQAKNQRKTAEGTASASKSANQSQDNSGQSESGKDTQSEAGTPATNEKAPLSEDKGHGSTPDKTVPGNSDIPSSVSLDGILSAIAEEEEVNSQAGPPT